MSNDERLQPNGKDDEPETTLWSGGYSGKAMYGAWLLALLASIAVVVVTVMVPAIGWLIGGVAVVLIWAYLGCLLVVRKLGVHYELTTQRLIHRTGILTRRTDRIELIDVDDVTFVQGIIQRMLGVGSVKMSSSDRSHPELTLLGIDGVESVADMIDDARRKERRRRGLHIEAI